MSHSKGEFRRLLGVVRAALDDLEAAYPFIEELAYAGRGSTVGEKVSTGRSDPVLNIVVSDSSRLASEALAHAFEGLKCADYAIAISDRAIRAYVKKPPEIAPSIAKLPLVREGLAQQAKRQRLGQE